MRLRFTLVLLTLFCAAGALAQTFPPPVIHSISPSSSPVAGGIQVTITGSGLTPWCGAYMMACPDAEVRIGGRPAEIVSRAGDRLIVLAPPNISGRADVEVKTPGGTARAVRAFAYGATDFRRLLLPVYIAGAIEGAEGSQWVTELSGFHRRPGVARVTGNPERESGTVAGRTTFSPELATERPGFGRFVYVAEENADAIVLNLRARDVSRELENLGTEIPVIAVEQTFTAGDDIALLNIPTQEQYRQKIRVYDFEGEFGRSVTLRVFGADPETPLLVRELTTTAGDVSVDYPPYPGQAELDLNMLPELAGIDRVTVIIETPDDGRWWGFASVTSNATQLITTVTP